MSLLAQLSLAATLTFQPATLPHYDDDPGLSDYADAQTYEDARADRHFVMQRFAYPTSDGLTVYAYVYRPREAPKEKLPVVIFNRGSWVRESFAGDMLPLAHRLAQAGYIVVAPFYRGSGGAGGTDEMGGADLADIFSLLPVIDEVPGADSRQLFLYGESRGGMMVYQALRDGFPARAAAVYGAFTDLAGLLADPRWQPVAERIWPDFEARKEQIIDRRSALRWADRISVPVLIMQGGEDGSVPPTQSLDLAAKLLAANKPFDLWIANGAGHVMTERAAERDERAIAWFVRYATAAGKPDGG